MWRVCSLIVILVFLGYGCSPNWTNQAVTAERRDQDAGRTPPTGEESGPANQTVTSHSLTGKERMAKPSIVGSRLVLATGDVRVRYYSFGGRKSGDITDQVEIRALIALLESSEIIGDVIKNPRPLRFTGVSLDIVYDAERVVTVHTALGGRIVQASFHGPQWVDVPWVYLLAPELAERLHALAEWRYFDVAELRDVQSIRFANDAGSFVLDDRNLIEPLVTGLRNATYIGPSKCPFGQNKLEFHCTDRVVYGLVAGDGCRAILLNENEYEMDENAYDILRRIVEERGLSLVPRR